MLNKLFKVATLCVLALIGTVGLMFYRMQTEKDRQIKEQAIKIEQQKLVIDRLGADRRVADLIVTKQTPGGVGSRPTTEVLFQEYDRDGKPLAPRFFTVDNDVIHVSGLVIKFEQKYVEEGTDLRGRSILLFDKIYGDHEGRDHGQPLDKPGQAPRIYQTAYTSPDVQKFEQDLWGKFWTMTNDESLRKSLGVDVAFGQSVFTKFLPGKRYTVRLQNNGAAILEEGDLPPEIGAALQRKALGGEMKLGT
ncbi:MAG: hypothetical protein QM770_03990 [Tepidisphaeraceae bacterium]